MKSDVFLPGLCVQCITRKHERTEKANVFQKRLVWDYLYKEEFVKVMLILSEPSELEKTKRTERDLFEVFTQFDTDRSGSIDVTEMGQAFEKMGRSVSLCACVHVRVFTQIYTYRSGTMDGMEIELACDDMARIARLSPALSRFL